MNTKEKIFYKRWFCKHKYEPIDDMRGFFGITQCVKCGNYGRLSDEEMVISTFKLPTIYSKDLK